MLEQTSRRTSTPMALLKNASTPVLSANLTDSSSQESLSVSRVSGLEAAFERGLESPLGFWVACAFAEETGIPTEVLDLRERDRIDALLDRGDTGARELGDPMSERSDEIAELLRGQGAIGPAVPLSSSASLSCAVNMTSSARP